MSEVWEQWADWLQPTVKHWQACWRRSGWALCWKVSQRPIMNCSHFTKSRSRKCACACACACAATAAPLSSLPAPLLKLSPGQHPSPPSALLCLHVLQRCRCWHRAFPKLPIPHMLLYPCLSPLNSWQFLNLGDFGGNPPARGLAGWLLCMGFTLKSSNFCGNWAWKSCCKQPHASERTLSKDSVQIFVMFMLQRQFPILCPLSRFTCSVCFLSKHNSKFQQQSNSVAKWTAFGTDAL